MGGISNAYPERKGNVNFAAVKAALNNAGPSLVPGWLPGGVRIGDEWVVRNPTRNDASRGSFSVNLVTGVWSDFATGDKGGDLIDLYAYIFGVSLLQAAAGLGAKL